MLAVSVLRTGQALAPLAVTAFIPARAVTVLLALRDTLPSNTELPWLAVTISWCVCAIYVTWPVTHWTIWVLVFRVKSKSPLALAARIIYSTMSTLKQTRFIVWPTLPKSAAI
jgi:hypothetical protein